VLLAAYQGNQGNQGKAAIALGEGSTTLAGASQNGVLAGLRHSF
jgi:predicted porin